MKAASIPVYDFTSAVKEDGLFKFISLGELTNYDFSAPHRHNYYEIFFFTKGGGSHLIDFINYPIHDHSIHFISPGQVHVIKRAADSYGSLVLFTKEFFHPALSERNTLHNFPFLNNSQYPVLATSHAEYTELEQVLDHVKKEFDRGHGMYKEILRSYLNVILLKCLQLFHDKHPGYTLKHSSVFNAFRQLVEAEYREQRQPAYYAGKLNITEKKLNNLCKDNTGENVGNYIKSRILLEAKRLLTNTDHTVKEIAELLGYDDPAYFTRFFTANVGMTAGDFRKSGN